MKIETKTTHHVCYRELEETIEKEYGFTYSMPADLECGNHTSHEYSTYEEWGEWEDEELQEWKDAEGRKQLWGPELLIRDMARRGVIPEGDYIINISW